MELSVANYITITITKYNGQPIPPIKCTWKKGDTEYGTLLTRVARKVDQPAQSELLFREGPGLPPLSFTHALRGDQIEVISEDLTEGV